MKIDTLGNQVRLPALREYYTCTSDQQARYLAALIGRACEAAVAESARDGHRWRFGWLTRKGSAWVGVHYSDVNKRWCINLIPCVTFWITKPGGNTP